ncbi:hypothetical protein P278_23710 [Zhouia amylolytica AD3]|uniref:Uncharacterized protein n=1 Tax=Zhouia amylolytica AD3 TaxID=1286632 RepID=W2UKA1_9FLAO|nr:hypothetical protein P278_23710 [Zhouia amylolytica AD3]
MLGAFLKVLGIEVWGNLKKSVRDLFRQTLFFIGGSSL